MKDREYGLEPLFTPWTKVSESRIKLFPTEATSGQARVAATEPAQVATLLYSSTIPCPFAHSGPHRDTHCPK